MVDESYRGHHRWRLPEASSFPEVRNSKTRSGQEERKRADGEPRHARAVHEKADHGIAFRQLHRSVGFAEGWKTSRLRPTRADLTRGPHSGRSFRVLSFRGFKMKRGARLDVGEREEREDERSARRAIGNKNIVSTGRDMLFPNETCFGRNGAVVIVTSEDQSC